MHYRTIKGRTFHNDKHASLQYFTPNDDKQQASIDISHHYLTLALDGKLFLAPVPDSVKKAVDIGTGTGIWALDFADAYPNCEVIGTDLSPIQPTWVPPNVRFEIDDATEPWTWTENSLDFVHIRYIVGAISNWTALFHNAFLCSAPGGWLESVEYNLQVGSDDGTADPVYKELWNLFDEAGKKTGRSFRVLHDNEQRKGMEAAGFTDIQEYNVKMPIGGWPADPKLSEIGQYIQLTLENDIEGYTLFIWNNVMGWNMEEYQVFLMRLRKAFRDRKSHAYFTVRYVWGQKPETAQTH